MKKLLLNGALVFCCLFIFNKTAFAQADLYLDSLNVYVDDYGSLGLYTLTPTDTIQQLARMTPLVGTADTSVFDYKNDMDIEDPTQFISNPKFSDYEIYGSYNNNYSGLAPNVLVRET